MLGRYLRDLLIDLEGIAAGRSRQQLLLDVAIGTGRKVGDPLLIARIRRRRNGRSRGTGVAGDGAASGTAAGVDAVSPGGSADRGVGGGATEIGGVSGMGSAGRTATSVSVAPSDQEPDRR